MLFDSQVVCFAEWGCGFLPAVPGRQELGIVLRNKRGCRIRCIVMYVRASSRSGVVKWLSVLFWCRALVIFTLQILYCFIWRYGEGKHSLFPVVFSLSHSNIRCWIDTLRLETVCVFPKGGGGYTSFFSGLLSWLPQHQEQVVSSPSLVLRYDFCLRPSLINSPWWNYESKTRNQKKDFWLSGESAS